MTLVKLQQAQHGMCGEATQGRDKLPIAAHLPSVYTAANDVYGMRHAAEHGPVSVGLQRWG